MSLIIYSTIQYILMPVFLVHILWRSIRNPGYRQNISQRFGFLKTDFNGSRTICVHAVSVGEVRAIAPAIELLLEKYTDHRILVTTTTPTGKDQVKLIFENRVDHAYLPWDSPGATRRFLNKVRPDVFIIVETELWPNLFIQLKKNEIPLIIANARLSEKSARGYLRFKTLSKLMLGQVDLLLAQTETHAKRFIQIGMQADQIKVMGNLKYDLILPGYISKAVAKLKAQLGNRQIWVAASTHEGEDEILLSAYGSAKKQIKDLLLILVPRHPERFDRVYDSTKNRFNCCKFSKIMDIDNHAEVIIGDVMGQLIMFYYIADIAFIGGSLVERGGQNPIEASATGTPMLMGNSRYNFEEVTTELIAGNAMRVVTDSEGISENLTEILTNKQLHDEMAQSAKKIYNANKGAVNYILEAVDNYL